MSGGNNEKMLTVSRKLAKILTVSRKSHHPIETLMQGSTRQVTTGRSQCSTKEPRFNEVPKGWGNWFVISRVRDIENLGLTNLRKN